MMKASTRRELHKLRELASFLLQGQVCCFCKKPLSKTAEDFTTHGNSIGPKIAERISVHHHDGDHENNARENKSLCHTKCHKAHHRREANLALSAERKLNKPVDL